MHLPLLRVLAGGLALAALLTPAASAQTVYACVAHPNTVAFPPDPYTPPYPADYGFGMAPDVDAPAARRLPRAETPRSRWIPDRRPDALRRASAAASASRGGSTACPTTELIRHWNGEAWQAEERVDATLDEAGRPLSITWALDRSGTGEVQPAYGESYTYDAAGRMATLTYSEAGSGGQLVPSYRGTYTYDAQSRLESVRGAYWNGTAWVTDFRAAITFGGGPYLASYVTETREGAGWVTDSRGVFTYDGPRLTRVVLDRWDGEAWITEERETLTYDGEGGMTEHLFENAYDSDELTPQERQVVSYDANGRVATAGWEYWEGEWVRGGREEFAYHASGQLAEATGMVFQDGTFVPNYRVLFTYEAGALAGTTQSYRDGAAWVVFGRTDYRRDGAGRLTERLSETFNGGEWGNDASTLFAYDGVTAAADAPAPRRAALVLAPNPARDRAVARFDLVAPARVRIAVCDVLGRRVATVADAAHAAGPHEVALDLAALAPGVYVLRLEAGAQTTTRRFTVVR